MMQFCKHGVPLGVCTLCDKNNLKPQWQGLTDDEIWKHCQQSFQLSLDDHYYDLYIKLCRAIEQALKEKNHD